MPVSDFDFSGGPVPDWLVALLSQTPFAASNDAAYPPSPLAAPQPMGMPGRAYGPLPEPDYWGSAVPGALATADLPRGMPGRAVGLPIPMGMPGRSVSPPAPAAAPAGGWPLPPEKPAPRASERLRGASSKSRYGQYVPAPGDAQHQLWAELAASDPRIYRGRA